MFWKKYIAGAQLDLSIAAYTKVPKSWKDHDYIPDFNKLYFITEGEGYVKVGEQELYPQPGDMVLLPAGELQSYGTISDNTFGKYWCHFKAKIGNLHLFQVVKTGCIVRIDDVDSLKREFERLIRYSRSGELTSGFRVNAILLEIIAQFIDGCEAARMNTTVTSSVEKMSEVLKYIEGHLDSDMTVEDLAQIAHFHPNYFIRLFKNFTGHSPIQYINRMRLEKAKHLLTLTEWNVSLIADAVGMELYYFSRIFKEYTGFSPTAYREMVQSLQG
jgi:AraC-like DNA-binding protein